MKTNLFTFTTTKNRSLIKKTFNKYGFVILKNFHNKNKIIEFRNTIFELLKKKAESYKIHFKKKDNNIHSLLKLVHKKNKNIHRELFFVIRDLPIYYDLINNVKIINLMKCLLDSNIIDVSHESSIFRIDSSFNRKRQQDWHQDYPYILGSKPGIATWTPINDISKSMGSPLLIPRSHEKAEKVTLIKNHSQYDPNTLKILDRKKLILKYKNNIIPSINIKAGDTIIMHGFLLHRSGKNFHTTKSRWVLTTRYSNPLSDEMINSGWKRTRVETKAFDLLKIRHPELIG